jgi:hypothetical protein
MEEQNVSEKEKELDKELEQEQEREKELKPAPKPIFKPFTPAPVIPKPGETGYVPELHKAAWEASQKQDEPVKPKP